MGFVRRIKRWLKRRKATNITLPAPQTPAGHRISSAALLELGAAKPRDTWIRPEPPHWLASVMPGGDLAMDSLPWDQMQQYALGSNAWTEALGFLGYTYLAELAQRPEFRRPCEIWAAQCTRKWIRLTGDNPERLMKLEESMKHFGVREKFRKAIEIDGLQGRSHIFMDFGDSQDELLLPLATTPETITPGSLKNLKVVEAYWCYPLDYDTNNPLSDKFYSPQMWQVISNRVHNSRLMTFVGREMPDLLKPVYMFGGLSLTQMIKPYVDNYIRNRTSIGNLIYSFSTMVLSTQMDLMLTDVGAKNLLNRITQFTYGRDNGGLFMLDKATEELKNVSAPLSGLPELLSQSMEQILIPAGIPMVIYAGTTPAGLNASTSGELAAFHEHILGYNEKTCGGPLSTLLRVLQLNLDGEVDESVGYEWIDLADLTEIEKADMRSKQVLTDCELVDRGIIDGEEVRARLKADKDGPYYNVELVGPDIPLTATPDG